jgi:hypothetical protein
MTLQQDREQLFLELVNRARLDPLAEGRLQGVADLSAGSDRGCSASTGL